MLVFAGSEAAAEAAAGPLRNVLWGQHSLSVLLPHGEEPIQVPLSIDTILETTTKIETEVNDVTHPAKSKTKIPRKS